MSDTAPSGKKYDYELHQGIALWVLILLVISIPTAHATLPPVYARLIGAAGMLFFAGSYVLSMVQLGFWRISVGRILVLLFLSMLVAEEFTNSPVVGYAFATVAVLLILRAACIFIQEGRAYLRREQEDVGEP